MKVKIIGLGGVGYWLVHPLCLFLSTVKGRPQLTLIDGDHYEEKNRDRQVFDKMGNKAFITATTLDKEYGRAVQFFHEPQYIDEHNAVEYIRDGDIVFACVDNHPSRLLISNRCEKLKDVVCISGGNEFFDGGVQCFVRKNGKNVTLPLANKFHPEVLNPPEDNHPLRLQHRRGCDTMIKSEPQLVFTNHLVASHMLAAFYGFTQGKLNYDEVFVDVLYNLARTEKRSN